MVTKGGEILKEEDSILETVREAVVGVKDNKEFDHELKIHINSALAELNQNGVGKTLFVTGEEQTWGDFKDPTQTIGNDSSPLIPMYVFLSTNILFDPPPPSNVDHYARALSESLWRLKIAYEEDQK